MEPAAPRLGPLVHRSVHHGAALFLVASVQFVVVMAVVQLVWTHPYSLSTNYISDLGNTGCGPWPDNASPVVCSPWHDVFNVSVAALGVLFLLGAILVKRGFPPRRSTTLGLGLLAVAAVGAIGVGASPENVNLTVHSVSAAVAFGLGNLSLAVLGFAMFRDTRWDGYRAYTLFSGVVGLVAFVLFLTHAYLGLGVGGMERLTAAPLLLWAVVAGVHLLRVPAYAPARLPSSAGR